VHRALTDLDVPMGNQLAGMMGGPGQTAPPDDGL
jgi:hypothetical protein